MFRHIFVTRIKCLFREKSLIFWTLVFPLALSTFFNLAFSNLSSTEKFEPIDIAVIDNEKLNEDVNFKSMLDSLSKEDENQIFNVVYLTEQEAKDKLEKYEISGYINVDNEIELFINKNGFNQTIIKSFLDQYKQISSTISTILTINPDAIKNGLMEEIANHQSYIQGSDNTNTDAVVLYFYSLIGMVCMYAGFWGIKTVNESEANLSSQGARLSISPVHKLKAFLYSLSAAFIIQYIELLIILAYMVFILGIDFGNQIGYIMLLCFVGCFAGISFGSMVGSMFSKDENTKIAILISVSMILSFLSGMMFLDMKYIISENVPILANINPVNLITDALYSLYYYSTHTRFYTNIFYLIIFSIICCAVTYKSIRRKKYASL
jgi:ABC-2 type transport system permease protein